MKILTLTCLLAGCQSALQDADRSSAVQPAQADMPVAAEVAPEADDLTSQPLIVPLISSDPKLGSSVGLMAAYTHQFDKASPASMFGMIGKYSTTDSYHYGLVAKAFWHEDRNRITAIALNGKIRNDFDDFLGTGLPAQTTDNITIYGARYLRKVQGPWYLGIQGMSSNYLIAGENALSQAILDLAGLTGLDSVGVGVAAVYDTKDNQNSAHEGMALQLHNLAYRESLGGDEEFDALNADVQWFLPHGEESVTALHMKARWTLDAPPSGFSSVDLRGYTRGQFLAENAVAVEVDERIMLTSKWGVAAFTGVAGLFGDGTQDSFKDNLYPNIGAGAFYQISDDRMVIRADLALGIEGHHGFYLSFNHPF